MKEEKRRHPLDKQKFGEGVRQKFAMVFLAVSMFIMGIEIYNPKFDPVPFLQFLTVITGVTIGGLSGDAIMQAYKVSSNRQNENIDQQITEDRNENIHSVIEQKEEKLLQLDKLDPKDIDEEAFVDGGADVFRPIL